MQTEPMVWPEAGVRIEWLTDYAQRCLRQCSRQPEAQGFGAVFPHSFKDTYPMGVGVAAAGSSTCTVDAKRGPNQHTVWPGTHPV